jgi:hypothetical protein
MFLEKSEQLDFNKIHFILQCFEHFTAYFIITKIHLFHTATQNVGWLQLY